MNFRVLENQSQSWKVLEIWDHVYFVHPSTDVLVDMSTDTRLMCRSKYRPTLRRYIDRDMSVDMSTDILVNMSVDRECLSDCRPPCLIR